MSRSTFEGQSLILLAREAIGLAIAAEEQGARLFNHGIQSDVVITSTDTVDQETKTQLKEALNSAYSGSNNAFRALLLEGGLDIKRIGLTAQESQFLDARKYQLSDVARIFRIPSVMLGIIGDKANGYASTEQFFLSYEKHCLRPWCNRIEQTISRDLILPGESHLFAKHDLTDLLRADMKTRFDAYSVGILAGFVKPNEPRQWEGWQTDERLDVFLRPLNYTEIGKPSPAASPAANPAPSPVPPEDTATASSPARRLSCIAAASIISRERKWFERQASGSASAEQMAGFGAWHLNMVAETTGATPDATTEYHDWRVMNKGADVDAEAAQRIIELCMGEKSA